MILCSCSEHDGFTLPPDYPTESESLLSALSGTSWILEDSIEIILTQTLLQNANENVIVIERDLCQKSTVATLDFNSAFEGRYMYSLKLKNGLVYVVGEMQIETGHTGAHRLWLKADDQQLYYPSDNHCFMHRAFHSGRPLPGVATSWDQVRGTGRTEPLPWEDDVHFILESIETNPGEDSKGTWGKLNLCAGFPYARSDSANISSFVARFNFNQNYLCHP